MAESQENGAFQFSRCGHGQTLDAEHDAHRFDQHIGQAEGQQQGVVDAPAVKRPNQKTFTQQSDRARRQWHQQQAEPKAAGQPQAVDTEKSAHHEKSAMGKVHHGEHAKNQRQTDRQQRVHRAQRNAGHQLQGQQLGRDFKHAALPLLTCEVAAESGQVLTL